MLYALLIGCSTPAPLGPSHGGSVQESHGYQIEFRMQSSGLRVWVYDPAMQLVDPETIRGTAFIHAAGSMQKARFEVDGDGLRARAKLPEGDPAHAQVSLVVGAHTLEAEIQADNIGGIGFRENTPAHGGRVSIVGGKLRVEYAAVHDVHRFWLTDLQRRPISGEVEASLDDGGTDVPLSWDPAAACLSGEWADAGARPVRLTVRWDGADYTVAYAP